jgi:hypothetical protein
LRRRDSFNSVIIRGVTPCEVTIHSHHNILLQGTDALLGLNLALTMSYPIYSQMVKIEKTILLITQMSEAISNEEIPTASSKLLKRHSNSPKIFGYHGEVIRWLFNSTEDRQLEVFVDADFAGNWDPDETDDRDTARSRHRYLIYHTGCPIFWKSQLPSIRV